jgi:excisionase family DNA binding protein
MNERENPLNVQQAAEFLNLKPSYIYNLVFYGKLTAYKPGGKKLLFKISDLEKYAYGNKVGGYSERAETILNTAQKRKPYNKAKAETPLNEK